MAANAAPVHLLSHIRMMPEGQEETHDADHPLDCACQSCVPPDEPVMRLFFSALSVYVTVWGRWIENGKGTGCLNGIGENVPPWSPNCNR